MTSLQSVTPHELDTLRRNGQPIRLLDVRTLPEFRSVHPDLAVHLSLDHPDLTRPGTEPVYIIGRDDVQVRQACERLLSARWDNVIPVEGGIEAWQMAGLPVVRELSASAGTGRGLFGLLSLVVVVVLVALFVHPILAILVAILVTDPALDLFSDLFRPLRRAH